VKEIHDVMEKSNISNPLSICGSLILGLSLKLLAMVTQQIERAQALPSNK
jgi:hypothetical protein